jgi:hypothetical protein
MLTLDDQAREHWGERISFDCDRPGFILLELSNCI